MNSLLPGRGTIARLTYSSPFLIALQRLNDYNGSEFSRDVSLIPSSSPTGGAVWLALFPIFARSAT